MTNLSSLSLHYRSLLKPSQGLIDDIKKIEGNIMLLGAGGKMGPALATLIQDAVMEASVSKKIIAVSRFSDAEKRVELEEKGIEIYSADLLNDEELWELPEVENVIYMAGQKFGTTGRESFTWAMNAYLPGRVCEKFKHSKIVAFSTGNVYPLSAISEGGPDETMATSPLGEYAQSCLARERIFQYFSEKYKIPTLIYRLNYANDVSYGVLHEIAKTVWAGKPVDLAMGHVNVIWQGDANEIAIRSLLHCSSPAKILNVAGPETVSVKWVANQFAEIFNKPAHFQNSPEPTALLSNAAESFALFGYPSVTLKQMIEIIALWIVHGGKVIDKPTHFQEREGKY